MIKEKETGLFILVVEDVEETRDGIEKLLRADGYQVTPARDEADAIMRAKHLPPHLLLVSLGGRVDEVIRIANRIREQAGLKKEVPIIIFCVEDVAEGEEVMLANNIYLTRPDNFNQLRALIRRLLHQPSTQI